MLIASGRVSVPLAAHSLKAYQVDYVRNYLCRILLVQLTAYPFRIYLRSCRWLRSGCFGSAHGNEIDIALPCCQLSGIDFPAASDHVQTLKASGSAKT